MDQSQMHPQSLSGNNSPHCPVEQGLLLVQQASERWWLPPAYLLQALPFPVPADKAPHLLRTILAFLSAPVAS